MRQNVQKWKSLILGITAAIIISAPVFGQTEWVTLEGEEDIVLESFHGVDAVYTTKENAANDPVYSCAAYIKKYYKELYGLTVYNLMDDGPPLVQEAGYEFYETDTPHPGDIVFWPTSKNKNNHSAIIRKVEEDSLTLIEQNYKSGLTAAKGREIDYPSSEYVVYHLERDGKDVSFDEPKQEDKESEKVILTVDWIKEHCEYVKEGDIDSVSSRGKVRTDGDPAYDTYEYDGREREFQPKEEYRIYYNDEEGEWDRVRKKRTFRASQFFVTIETDGRDTPEESEEKDESSQDKSEQQLEEKVGEEEKKEGNSLIVVSPVDQGVSMNFTDVYEGYWAYDSILDCVSAGLLSGYADGSFRPAKTISRAELAVMVCKAAGLVPETVQKSSFVDVSTTDWYSGYVEAAKEYIPAKNGAFHADWAVSRSEMCQAAVMLLGFEAADGDQRMLEIFTDGENIPSDLAGFVAMSIEKGLIMGFEDNTFRGNDPVTRGQTAVIFSRLMQQSAEIS